MTAAELPAHRIVLDFRADFRADRPETTKPRDLQGIVRYRDGGSNAAQRRAVASHLALQRGVRPLAGG